MQARKQFNVILVLYVRGVEGAVHLSERKRIFMKQN
jgi:hypothetical protein